jgi:hypothetical protein
MSEHRDVRSDAYWQRWADNYKPTPSGPQPTATGYLLLAAYGKAKRALIRLVCFVWQHDIETEEWDEVNYKIENIPWHCRRCGAGGITR